MEDCLKLVDKCGLPGKFKAWIYQHGILQRLLWPLLTSGLQCPIVNSGSHGEDNKFLSQKMDGRAQKFNKSWAVLYRKQVADATQKPDRRIQGHKGSPSHHAAEQWEWEGQGGRCTGHHRKKMEGRQGSGWSGSTSSAQWHRWKCCKRQVGVWVHYTFTLEQSQWKERRTLVRMKSAEWKKKPGSQRL